MTKLRNHLDYMMKDSEYNYVVNDEMCRTMYNGKKMVNETHKNK